MRRRGPAAATRAWPHMSVWWWSALSPCGSHTDAAVCLNAAPTLRHAVVVVVGGCVQGGGGANAARPKVRYHLHRILVLITVFCAAFVLLLSVHAILNGASLLRHTMSFIACGLGEMVVHGKLQDGRRSTYC